jgi:hypothetical protein
MPFATRTVGFRSSARRRALDCALDCALGLRRERHTGQLENERGDLADADFLRRLSTVPCRRVAAFQP